MSEEKTEKKMSDKMSIILMNEADAITGFIGFLLRENALLKGADPSALNPKPPEPPRDSSKDFMAAGLDLDVTVNAAANALKTATQLRDIQRAREQTSYAAAAGAWVQVGLNENDRTPPPSPPPPGRVDDFMSTVPPPKKSTRKEPGRKPKAKK